MKGNDLKTLLNKGLTGTDELTNDQLLQVIHVLIDIIRSEKRDFYSYFEIITRISEERMQALYCHLSFAEIYTLLTFLEREKSNCEKENVDMLYLDEIYFGEWISFMLAFYIQVAKRRSIKYFLLKVARVKQRVVNLILFQIANRELGYDTLFELTEFIENMQKVHLWSEIVYVLNSMQFDLDLYKILEDSGQREIFEQTRFLSKKANYYEKRKSESKILWVQLSIIFCFVSIVLLFPIYIYIFENFFYSNRITYFNSIYVSVMHACSASDSSFSPSFATDIILIIDNLMGLILIGFIAGLILDWIKPIYKR